MAACETCWTEANRQALMLGGSTVDRYRELVRQHPDGHDDKQIAPGRQSPARHFPAGKSTSAEGGVQS